ncbi:mechanosensitive ion channel family protein [Chitinophaga nivalis]|uniref:Mechanosensitive ion channel family protein n=1 Tax=Chitinophaga nivalis TaxID=2991709 RepID=A0ABT3IW06_9BACT|nr:mechanosensitive ion channel family protein [Chitinophaga nivalis]MCW3462425.1 mechanosensitive ion channel family protein [Chitinophaga nivalis]MCW3487884.1 mechanosensitive ion channel family protein [Chitinophaga nivalis]
MRCVLPLLLTNILVALSLLSPAQTDSAKASRDSVTNAQLESTTRLLRESDSLLKADAAAKQSLEQQILLLKNDNDRRKQELVKKLTAIEQADSLKKAANRLKINQLKAVHSGIPVAPFGDTLFFVYNKLGPLHPGERARNIHTKLERLENDPFFAADSILVLPNENNVDVVYQDIILLTVTDDDGLWLDQDKAVVANEYAAVIRKAVIQAKDQNSLQHILIRIAWLLLILLVFGVIVYLINRLFRKLRFKFIKEKDHYFKGVKVKDYALLNQQKQIGLVYSALRIARIVIILLVFYITLPFIFSIFPWTKGIADKLIDWTLTPIKSILSGLLHYLPKLLTILVIYFITRYLVKLVNYLAGEIACGNLPIKGFYADWAWPTASGVKFLLYAFMFVVIFPYLPGSDSKVFQGVSVFLGILFSLGSSTAISNVVAGFVITYMRPFKIGDQVKIGEITGEVIEKNLLVTRLRTTKNEEITVPNASILSGHTINFTTSSKDPGLILHTGVTIGYDVPWKQVHELLIKAAMATDGIMKDKAPFVLQTSLDDFYVAYELNAYTDQSHEMAGIYSLLHQQIQDQFNAAGVEIMSPHYRAHRDGGATTTPADYLPDNYQAPPLRVKIEKAP